MTTALLANLGPTELLIIFGVLIFIFGASKLPELARGSGRALRIFKAETKGLGGDEDDQGSIGNRRKSATSLQSEKEALDRRQAELDAEHERLERDGLG